MDIANEINKIKKFLVKNGWKKEPSEEDEDYFNFNYGYNYSISIGKEDGEIVVIADEGDIFHIKLHSQSLYTLVGFLVLRPLRDQNYKG